MWAPSSYAGVSSTIIHSKGKSIPTRSLELTRSLWLIQSLIPIPGGTCHDYCKVTPKYFKSLCIDDRGTGVHTPSWSRQDNLNNDPNSSLKMKLSLVLAGVNIQLDFCFDALHEQKQYVLDFWCFILTCAEWIKTWGFVHSSMCCILTARGKCLQFVISQQISLNNKIMGLVWWILIGISSGLTPVTNVC